MLPVGIDKNPYGFMGKLQAVRCAQDSPSQIADKIFRWLFRTPSAQAALTNGIVTALERSGSYVQALELFKVLKTLPTFAPDQLRRLEAAATDNPNVRGAHYGNFPKAMQAFLAERGGSPASAVDDSNVLF